MSQHHDRTVGDALRRLDVPDHGPDFWAALDDALAAEGGTTSATGALPDDDGADVIDLPAARDARGGRARGRRRIPAVAAAAAAAAALALGVGLPAVQQAADGDAPVDVANGPTGPDPSDPTGTTETVPSTPDPAMTAEQAEADAVEWLDRLFAGDVEGAYGLLDDASRAAMAYEEFELLGSGLFEGAAAFAGDDIDRSVLRVETADGVVSVVTFSGDVEREGMVETAAYPVVLTDTGVHFTLDGPRLEIDSAYLDSSGTTLTSPLVMQVGDVDELWVRFDEDSVERLEQRGRVEVDVEGAVGPGTHVVTLVAVQDGRLVARAHTVVVP